MRTLGFLALALLLPLTSCGSSEPSAPDPAVSAVDEATGTAGPDEPTAPTERTGPPVFAEAAMRELPIGSRLRTPGGATVVLKGTSGRHGVRAGSVQIVVRHDGDVLRATVPAGWTPTLVTPVVRLGQGVEGFLVSQEGGDSRTLTLYVARGGRLVPATVRGGVAFGGGFRLDDAAAFRTWIGRSGEGLFTALALEPGGDRYRVYSWVATGLGEGANGPADEHVAHDQVALDSTDEGVFCLVDGARWHPCAGSQ